VPSHRDGGGALRRRSPQPMRLLFLLPPIHLDVAHRGVALVGMVMGVCFAVQ